VKNPYANSFNISAFNSQIVFGSLCPGTYTYKVCAYDSNGGQRTVSSSFTVQP
jgi:hypothetical protein